MTDTLVTKYYALEKLAFGQNHKTESANCRRLVVLFVEPGSWDVNGGPGTVEVYSIPIDCPPYYLLIRQSELVHVKVSEFLGDLKKITPSNP